MKERQPQNANIRGESTAPCRLGAQRRNHSGVQTPQADLRAERRAPSAKMDMANRALLSGLERSDTIKRPGSGVDRAFEFSSEPQGDRSGRLRGCLLGHAFCLRTLLSLNNFEFNVIALLEALISLRLDGTVVDEHIRAVIPADKAEALCVIEPFHFTFNSRHVPYSGRSLAGTAVCGPVDQFSSLGFATFFGRDAERRRFTFSQHDTPYTHTLALSLFCLHRSMMSTDVCPQRARS